MPLPELRNFNQKAKSRRWKMPSQLNALTTPRKRKPFSPDKLWLDQPIMGDDNTIETWTTEDR
jgi:hypothetical protein